MGAGAQFVERQSAPFAHFAENGRQRQNRQRQMVAVYARIIFNFRLLIFHKFKSGGGPPHSRTLARIFRLPCARSVLECASPLALSSRRTIFQHRQRTLYVTPIFCSCLLKFHTFQSGGGPPHSKTLARIFRLQCARSVLECASPLALSPHQSRAVSYSSATEILSVLNR